MRVLNFAYKHGIRYFDTAPSYGKGEEFLTNWNSKYQHKDVSLSTKWDIPMCKLGLGLAETQ
jgi:aryl-alcohol dehydrogenase-like predicted oxidoreductase